jgi:hypothetical protein
MAGAVHLCHSAGRVWFEVELVEASQSGHISIGFAGTNFRNSGQMFLGGNALSWGISETGSCFHGSPRGERTFIRWQPPAILPVLPTTILPRFPVLPTSIPLDDGPHDCASSG